MIVGIDPGTTVGFAVLDLDGNPVKVGSFKNKSIDDLVRILSSYEPVLVSSDVAKVPEAVKKVAIAFNATVFHPTENLQIEEKVKLIRGHSVSNVHERDALAAAIKAYKHYSSKLRKAKKLAAERQEDILRAALREVRLSDVAEPHPADSKENTAGIAEVRKELGIEKKKAIELERKNKELRKRLAVANKKISVLERKLARVEKFSQKEEVAREHKEEKHASITELEPDEVEKLFLEYKKNPKKIANLGQ
ncbi:MAG: DUF460 domain-containing protein [Candidatus Diapherotrites archaeon]|nr:DUF460 domain-containing protein [Candidatus Diapherotrites archaeon]